MFRVYAQFFIRLGSVGVLPTVARRRERKTMEYNFVVTSHSGKYTAKALARWVSSGKYFLLIWRPFERYNLLNETIYATNDTDFWIQCRKIIADNEFEIDKKFL